MYAQPPETAARSYMYGPAPPVRSMEREVGYRPAPTKKLKKKRYNESRVSNRSITSYNSYNSYGSDLNNTRRRIEYREGYKKK